MTPTSGPKQEPVTGDDQPDPLYRTEGICGEETSLGRCTRPAGHDRQRTSDAFSERDCADCGLPHPMDPCAARSVAIDEGLSIGLGIDTKDVTDGIYTIAELCRVRAFALEEGMQRAAAAIVGVAGMGWAIRHRRCPPYVCEEVQATAPCWEKTR